jgi:hypothetical protein
LGGIHIEIRVINSGPEKKKRVLGGGIQIDGRIIKKGPERKG